MFDETLKKLKCLQKNISQDRDGRLKVKERT